MNRRHFLVGAGSALPCCLIPENLIRHAAAAFEADDPLAAIAAPEGIPTTLYALDDGDRLLFSYGSTRTEPEHLTWRQWADMDGVDADDPDSLKELLLDHALLNEESDPVEMVVESPEDEVPDCIMESYLDWNWAHTDSPQAWAHHYLFGLGLGNSKSEEGELLGELTFYEGPCPGSNWTWVETDSKLVLPALQRRLLELGEDVRVELRTM